MPKRRMVIRRDSPERSGIWWKRMASRRLHASRSAIGAFWVGLLAGFPLLAIAQTDFTQVRTPRQFLADMKMLLQKQELFTPDDMERYLHIRFEVDQAERLPLDDMDKQRRGVRGISIGYKVSAMSPEFSKASNYPYFGKFVSKSEKPTRILFRSDLDVDNICISRVDLSKYFPELARTVPPSVGIYPYSYMNGNNGLSFTFYDPENINECASSIGLRQEIASCQSQGDK